MKGYGLLTSVMLLVIVMTMSVVEARYLRRANNEIPDLLNKVYGEVGHEKFKESWKEFNSRNSEQQDDFLMNDLSNEELAQLGQDFEELGNALVVDPKLVDLYADFEHNLNTLAFQEMDNRLSNDFTWWGRIKRFLYRKLEKLANEINRNKESQLMKNKLA